MIAQCLNGPVQAGDWVRVVLPVPCCGSRVDIGYEYRVTEVERVLGECIHCGALASELMCSETNDSGTAAALLIRIDPPAVPDAVQRETEVTA